MFFLFFYIFFILHKDDQDLNDKDTDTLFPLAVDNREELKKSCIPAASGCDRWRLGSVNTESIRRFLGSGRKARKGQVICCNILRFSRMSGRKSVFNIQHPLQRLKRYLTLNKIDLFMIPFIYLFRLTLTGILLGSRICDHFQTSFVLELVAMSVFALKLLMIVIMKALLSLYNIDPWSTYKA